MQIFIYCKATLHVSGVTAPIIKSTKINYSTVNQLPSTRILVLSFLMEIYWDMDTEAVTDTRYGLDA